MANVSDVAISKITQSQLKSMKKIMKYFSIIIILIKMY
jgi:hypothetical protein